MWHVRHDPESGSGEDSGSSDLPRSRSNSSSQRFFGPQARQSLAVLTETGMQSVQVVTTYTHLGCTLHHKGDMRQEARRCFGIAISAFQQHRKVQVLYQKKHLSIERRAGLFRILILIKFVYGCESWTFRDKGTKHFVHTSLMKLYRRFLPQALHSQLSDAEVLSRTGLSDPFDLFRIQRLRHLGALYRNADSVP